MGDTDSSHDSDRLATVVLTALWGIPLLIIGIHGEFPLNDDWAYARTTRLLLETGRFERDAWSYAPIFSNVGIGVLFSWIFGFSFESLRLSGVFMGWLGLVGSYWLFREIGVGLARSFVGAAVVGFNPVYLNLSYTFMTDVPFTALSIWSLFFFARGLRRSSWPALAGGVAFALAATFSRQPGLALAPAVVLGASAAPDERLRRRLIRWGALAVVGAGAALTIAVAFGAAAPFRIPEFVRASSNDPSLVRALARHGLVTFANLGLYLSPVVALMLARGAGLTRRGAAWSAFVAGGLLVGLWLGDQPMPLGGNVLYDLGVGPYTVRGARFLPAAPRWLWWGVTAIAVFAGTFALAMTATDVAKRRFRGRPDRLLLLVFPLLYLAPLLAVDNFFDRYLLPMLAPFAAILLTLEDGASRSRARHQALSLALLAALAVFGTLGTHDYLERSRARWSLLEPLIARGVLAERVDAGFEFEGWSGLRPSTVQEKRRRGRSANFVVSHLDPRHLQTFRPIDARRYRRLLPPGFEGIALFKRSEPPDLAP